MIPQFAANKITDFTDFQWHALKRYKLIFLFWNVRITEFIVKCKFCKEKTQQNSGF